MKHLDKAIDIELLIKNIVIPQSDNLLQAQRLFHGRGHAYKGLEHITIDCLSPLILITLFEPVSKNKLALLSKELLNKFVDCKSIQVQHRYHKSWDMELLYGNKIDRLIINESKLRYRLSFKSGSNVGLFLDMKHGRDWVAQNTKDKKVLNLFSYTCGFSIAAAASGASSVFNIDMSSSFLSAGRENHRLNNHQLENIRFEKLNILKSFGRIKKQAPYDLIICDPPTFQKGSFDIKRDYPKLIRRLTPFLNPNGQLFLCINTPHIGDLTGRAFLLKTVLESGYDFELVDEIIPPSVFRDIQGKGTKVLIFKLCHST